MDQLIHSKRLMRGAVAAFVLAAALLLAVGVAQAEAPDQAVVDTSGTITKSGTSCTPCHLQLGKVDKPGLIFDHGNHLLVSCEGCHSRFPHRQGGGIESVPMEQCFACHGVQHGPQGELATSSCRDCHTKSFELRPSTHTSQWAKKPHADKAKSSGVNDCLMCHTADKDCDPCHKREAVNVKLPDVYHSVIAIRSKGPSVKIYPEGKVSMSQCVYCHPDIDKITGGRLIFAHAEHLRRNYSCETCHPKFPHDATKEKVAVPDMQSCYRCHGLKHAAQGVVAGEECGKCHPKSFELMPDDHTKSFIKGEHKKRAGSDPAYCAMCHKSQFCVDCHVGKKVSPNAPGKPVIPQDHRKAEWRAKHGGLYLQAKGACGSCHDGPSCQRCHKTVMPHPVGWIENHRPPAGTPAGDCNVCHTDRETCQNCHHNKVKNAELTAENCTGCHDEMKQKPAVDIQNKSFAEHAVHFDVAKKKKKPYRCDDCHTGFGRVAKTTASGNNPTPGAAEAHDLRLCYGCHGALDFKSVLIAPYSGAELCRRCHSNLNI